MNKTHQPGEIDSSNMDLTYKKVYWLGSLSCLVLIIYSLVSILIIALIGGQPVTIEECFSMLNENKLHGLLRLDILNVFIMPLRLGLVFLYSLQACCQSV